jgi:Leucine-rich repeat (LRR) protein
MKRWLEWLKLQRAAACVGLISAAYCACVVTAACVGNVSVGTYDVLQDFYDSLHGSQWAWSILAPSEVEWEFPSSLSAPCGVKPWYGLSCEYVYSLQDCQVFSVELSSFRLSGQLPLTLSSLPYLNVLFIPYNSITGPFPDDIGRLSNLTYLNVESNSITGFVPTSLMQMSSLVNITLVDNYFTGVTDDIILPQILYFLASINHFHGTLPAAFGSQTSLVYLDFSSNTFQGSIPAAYGNLRGLEGFAVTSNDLCCELAEELYSLTSLTVLLLYDNHFNGTLSEKVGQLTRLAEFGLNVNHVSGLIPRSIGSLTNLYSLSLNSNRFNGTIPSEMYLLTGLNLITLANNRLNGTLATEIGELSLLNVFEVQYNFFSHTIPSEFGRLSNLQHLLLYYNSFVGIIPPELENVVLATEIMLFKNELTGPIPSGLYGLPLLQQLDLSSNRLTGTVSTLIDGLHSLSYLDLAFNSISGSIPSEIGLNVNIVQLVMSNNFLNGTLPTELSACVLLEVLEVDKNLISGRFPEIFGGMLNVSNINMGGNGFTGLLPTGFINPQGVRFLSFEENQYSGQVPQIYFDMSDLQDLSLGANYLTGTLPSTNSFVIIESFGMNDNLLTGPLPSSFQHIIPLKSVQLQGNYFSGAIPEMLSTNLNLESLNFGANMLSQTIPPSLARLLRLQVMNVSDNSLHGDLADLFKNSSSFSDLQILDLSLNGFSGRLPDAIFTTGRGKRKLLSTIVLYSNCFTGSLPPTICNASDLTTVVLDALSSAPPCRKRFGALQPLFKAVVSDRPLQGTIPSCLWSMPALKTLHLSGNGLGGTLGELKDSYLTDISLASNRLVGSLPLSWQTWGKFVQLDVSSNKLSGTLSSKFVPAGNNSKLDITVNRLSGDIPASLRDVTDVNILEGNLFQCNQQSVPQNDPDKSSYVCGSDDFNIYVIVWLSCFAASLIYMRVNYEHFKQLGGQASPFSFDRSAYGLDLRGTGCFLEFIIKVARLSTVMGGLCILVALAGYIVFKEAGSASSIYSTHSVQYAWLTTVAYLHGTAPSILVLVLLFAMVVCMDWSLEIPFETPFSWPPPMLQLPTGRQLQRYVMITAVLVVHMVITIIVNVFYVYALLVGISKTGIIVLQGALSIFKISWNNIFVVWVMKRLQMSHANHLLCSTFMVLFTFLVSPLIATFFSDTTCFRYIITDQPAVSSSFQTDQFGCDLSCISYGGDEVDCHSFCAVSGFEMLEVFTSVTPSWIYSFQCSSSIVTNYTPILIFAYALSGCVIPSARAVTSQLPNVHFTTFLPNFVRKSLDRLYLSHEGKKSSALDAAMNEVDGWKNTESRVQIHHRAFNSCPILSKCFLNIAVMCTFGLASPLLSAAVIVDSWVIFLVMRLVIVQFLQSNIQSGSLSITSSAATARLEASTRDTLVGLSSVAWLIVLTSALFWSFFVFDMMGDVYGTAVGGFMMLVPITGNMAVHPIAAFCGSRYRTKRLIKQENSFSGPLLTPHLSLNDDFEVKRGLNYDL